MVTTGQPSRSARRQGRRGSDGSGDGGDGDVYAARRAARAARRGDGDGVARAYTARAARMSPAMKLAFAVAAVLAFVIYYTYSLGDNGATYTTGDLGGDLGGGAGAAASANANANADVVAGKGALRGGDLVAHQPRASPTRPAAPVVPPVPTGQSRPAAVNPRVPGGQPAGAAEDPLVVTPPPPPPKASAAAASDVAAHAAAAAAAAEAAAVAAGAAEPAPPVVDATPPLRATPAVGDKTCGSIDCDAPWEDWRHNGTLAIAHLHAATGRAVRLIGSSDGGQLASVMLATGPVSFAAHGLGEHGAASVAAFVGASSEATTPVADDIGGVHHGPAASAARATRASVLGRTLYRDLRSASVVAPDMTTYTKGGGVFSSADGVTDTDVMVIDAAALPIADFPTVLKGYGPWAMLHVVVVGLPCDGAGDSDKYWEAIDEFMEDAKKAPPKAARPEGQRRLRSSIDEADAGSRASTSSAAHERKSGARRLVSDNDRKDLYNRRNFYCARGADANVKGVIGKSANARVGAVALTRYALWPSFETGWRAVYFPRAQARGMPVTVEASDLVMAFMRIGDQERDRIRFYETYKVPPAGIGALSTPFQLVSVARTATKERPPELQVRWAFEQLPIDVKAGVAGESVSLAGAMEPLEVETVDHHMPQLGKMVKAEWWSESHANRGGIEFKYMGRYLGMSCLSLLFTIDSELFTPIVLPMVETMLDKGLPAVMLMRQYPELPGLHVMTFLTNMLPRRFIGWQLEYDRSRVEGSGMHRYSRISEMMWEYSKVNWDTMAGHMRQEGAGSMYLVPPCYHPSLEVRLDASEVQRTSDFVFLGSLEWNVPRRKKLVDAVKRLGSLVTGHYKLGGIMVQFARQGDIQLNIHAFENPILELTRLIPLLANKFFIVSEDSKDTDLDDRLREGLAFVKAGDQNALVETVQRYMGASNADARDAVAQRGYEIVSDGFHCANSLTPELWADLAALWPEWAREPYFGGNRGPLDEAGY